MSSEGPGRTPAAARAGDDVTAVLHAWRSGDDHALEALLPMVYAELRSIAAHHLRRERSGHTLQPTALVHEAYLRLQELSAIRWQDREHFFAFASRIMRRVLVSHARSRDAVKRGAGATHLTLVDELGTASVAGPQLVELIDLDRALDRLALERPRHAQLVEMRFFGGLSLEEAAVVLDCSPRTLKRDWAFARAWLLRALGFTSS